MLERMLLVLQETAARLREANVVPTLGAVCGENSRWVGLTEDWCQRAGVRLTGSPFPLQGAERPLLERLKQLVADTRIQGVWLAPELLRSYAALSLPLRLTPEKDLNRLHPHNLGLLHWPEQRPRFPPEVEATMALLEHHNHSVAGRRVCLVGAPGQRRDALAVRLGTQVASLSCCSPGPDLPLFARLCDALFVLEGEALTPNLLRPGCLVVDLREQVAEREQSALAWAASAYLGGLEQLQGGFLLQGLLENCLRLAPTRSR